MLLTALIFIAILGILVCIHELGHYTVARLTGVKVEEFGFGLPPRIWGKKIKGTVYSLNWLPIGGFVKLAGEDEDESERHKKIAGVKQSEYFWAKSKKQRGAILIAGVAMNFILAWAITTGLLVSGVAEPSGRVHIETVVAGSPAAEAGLMKNDIISSVTYLQKGEEKGTKSVRITSDLINTVKAHVGEPVTLAVIRNGREMAVTLTPRVKVPKGQGAMGVAVSDLESHYYPLPQAVGKGFTINIQRGWDMLAGVGATLWKLVQFKSVAGDVAGPIGIAQVTGETVKFGWKAVLELMSIISLNLAVLNVLPIPALDGGRLAFVFIEKFLGRKVKPAFEKTTHQIGMIVLLILVVVISINDIFRLSRGG